MTPVASLAERVLDLVLEAEPLEATLLGFRSLDGRLADLSVEHELRSALQTVRQRFEAVFELMPNAVWIAEGERIVFVNRLAE